MPSYHVWTVGWQMNMSDSAGLGAGLNGMGLDVSHRVDKQAKIYER